MKVSNRTQLARVLREQVFSLLGGKCARCPATMDLQVHILFDDHGAHHTFGSPRRWKFYLEATNLHLTELLCRKCHQVETTAALRRKRSGTLLPVIHGKVAQHSVTILPADRGDAISPF